MRILTFMTLQVFLIYNASAADCGVYRLKGLIHKSSEGLKLTVNKNSFSEKKLIILDNLYHKVLPYIDRYVELTTNFEKNLLFHQRQIDNIIIIKPSNPNILNSKENSFMRMVESKRCIK